jgi:hypothetical protein
MITKITVIEITNKSYQYNNIYIYIHICKGVLQIILFSASVLKLKHGEQNKHNCHDLVNQARNHNQTQNSICLGVWGKLIAAISLAHGAELQPARPSVLSTRLEPETHASHSWKSTKFCSPRSGPLQAHVCWCLHWAFHHLLSLFFDNVTQFSNKLHEPSIGLMEDLQETMVLPPNIEDSCRLSLKTNSGSQWNSYVFSSWIFFNLFCPSIPRIWNAKIPTWNNMCVPHLGNAMSI